MVGYSLLNSRNSFESHLPSGNSGTVCFVHMDSGDFLSRVLNSKFLKSEDDDSIRVWSTSGMRVYGIKRSL
jgi:hypothetical protein